MTIIQRARTRRTRLLMWVAGSILSWGLPVFAQTALTSSPCTQPGSLTTVTAFTSYHNNTSNPTCNVWALTWSTTGFTAVTIQLEGSDDNASWTAFSGATVVTAGTNPSSALSGTTKVSAVTKNAFLRVNLTAKTGTGAVNFQLRGASGIVSQANPSGAGAGGTCAVLGGDVTGTCAANTVVKVNGAVVPTSAVAVGTNASQQLIPATFQGNGLKVQASTGITTMNNCVKFDANGNTVDAGAACGTGSGTVTGVTASLPIASSGGTAPVISIPAANLSTTNSSVKLASFAGTAPVNGNCVNWLNGNVQDAGLGCAPVNSVYGAVGVITALAPTGTNTFDASGMTSANGLIHPVIAGAAPTTNGALAYDSTNENLHAAKASADAIILQTTATSAGNGNCMNWVNSGGSLKAGDAGAPCGSGGGSGGGVLTYSGPTLSVLSGTNFCPVGGGGACSATETNVDIDSAAVSTVSNLYVQFSQALGAGNSAVITWRKNTSSQTVTCTVSGAVSTSCNDTTHSFAVAQGDLLSYQVVYTGTIIVTPTVLIMSQFGTVNAGVTSVSATAPITSTGGTTPVISATYQGTSPSKIQGATGTTTSGNYLKYDATGLAIDSGVVSGNATNVNGASVPASAGLAGTNSSSQVVAASAHGASGVLDCIAASASGTAYTCSTSPSFTPASGDSIWFKADVANTASANLAVNAAAAKTIKKQGGGTNIVANDLLIGTWSQMTYDGTNWQMQGQVGNAAGLVSSVNGLTGAVVTSQFLPNTATSLPIASVPLTGWTNVNSGLVNDASQSSIVFQSPNNASLNWRMYVRSLGGLSTYTIAMHVDCRGTGLGVAAVTCGLLYLYDGTKIEGYEFLNGVSTSAALRIEKMNSVTSDGSTPFGATANLLPFKGLVKVVEDGVNRTWSHWVNGAWVQDLQEATNTFLTPTQFGFGGVSVVSGGSGGVYFTQAELNYVCLANTTSITTASTCL